MRQPLRTPWLVLDAAVESLSMNWHAFQQHADQLSEGDFRMFQNWNPDNHYLVLTHDEDVDEKDVFQSIKLHVHNAADNSEEGIVTDAPAFLDHALAGCLSHPIRVEGAWHDGGSAVTLTGSSGAHFNVEFMPGVTQKVSLPDLAKYFVPPVEIKRMYHAVVDSKQPRVDFKQIAGSEFELTVSDTHESSTVEPATKQVSRYHMGTYHKAVPMLAAKAISAGGRLPLEIHVTTNVGNQAIHAVSDGSSTLDARIDEPDIAQIHLNLLIDSTLLIISD